MNAKELVLETLDQLTSRIADYFYAIVGITTVVLLIIIGAFYFQHLTGIRTGTVVSKEYKPAYSYTTWDSITTCSGGKNNICTTTSYPRTVFVPESWVVTIRAETQDGIKQNWWNVDSSTFSKVRVGQCFSIDSMAQCDR